jgi:hypothetical protein
LRYSHLVPYFRSLYERSLPDYSQGDMLHGFIARCAQALQPDGEIAIVTSDRWLFNENAAKLREVIGARLGIAHLERLDVTSAFYRPKQRKAGTPPRIHPCAVVLRRAELCATSLSRSPIYPGAGEVKISGNKMLGEVATIRLGPYLGPHGIFVVDAATASTLPSELLLPAIDAADIKGGVLGTPTRFAIRTTREAEPPAVVMAHLDANLHRMPDRGQRKTKRWIPPETFERIDLSQPSLLIPRIASTLRPVRLPAGVLPIDHGLSIVTAGEASLEQIEEQLNRPEALAWVKSRAARLEHSFFSLTTRLLRTLPVDI